MRITQSLCDTFMTQGYLVIDNLLSADEIQALVDDYVQLLDRIAPQLYQQGKIPSLFSDLPFDKRLGTILSQSQENLFRYFDITLPNEDITEETPFHLSPAIFNMIKNERILDIIEQLIGGEILASPIQHVRVKPPQQTAERNPNQSSLVKQTGWHQDQGVSREEADDTETITVWLAITDATIDNGCLQVIPYSHGDGITTHCPSNEQMTIPETLLDGTPRPMPIKAGSALLLHRLTKHASLPNISDSIRWSFDLRYQPIGQATGRDELPSLIVRSRNQPELVQDDYNAWVTSWHDAQTALAHKGKRDKTHRWDGDAPVCA
ncbi:MAG: phytanoyl-CoA dioxygenase family protein [Chloroflexota bacterium]